MMTKYQEYKPSNVDFIGDIPKHWEVRKLKFIIKFQNGYAFKSDLFSDNGINVIRIGDISNNINYLNCKKSQDVDIDKLFKINKLDCLIALSGATTGKTCFVDNNLEDAYINQRVAKFNYKNKFLYYVVISDLFQEMIFLGADGSAQENISTNKLENIDIPLPPLKEQEKIANFLDTKNKQIEEFIKDKQNQIALLKEQKEAIINKAVTKGLDDSVEFKDSGIEWIGDIPKSWEVKKLKYLADIYNGSTPKSTVKEFWNGDITWISPQDISSITDGYIYNSLRTITKNGYDDCGTYLVPKNSIILTTRAPIGNIAIATKELCTNQGCKSIVVNNSNEYKYIYYLLIIFKETLQSLGTGTTFLELSTTNLTSFYMPTPSKEEQRQIVEYIEIETSKIDEIINQIQKEIDLIKEYKISLISEVVTGQIKVCDE